MSSGLQLGGLMDLDGSVGAEHIGSSNGAGSGFDASSISGMGGIMHGGSVLGGDLSLQLTGGLADIAVDFNNSGDDDDGGGGGEGDYDDEEGALDEFVETPDDGEPPGISPEEFAGLFRVRGVGVPDRYG